MDRRRAKRSVVDWLTVFATITIALALSQVPPDSHWISPTDLSLSYPHRPAKIPLPLFIIISIPVPIAIIAWLAYICPPRLSSTSKSNNNSGIIRRVHRLESLHTALLGLGVSLATSTMLSTGIKNLTGKPRPDFLERCKPHHEAGPMRLLGRSACTEQNWWKVNEAFRSFPSGYATIAFASLIYLSIYLTVRFHIIPSMRNIPSQASHQQPSEQQPRAAGANEAENAAPNSYLGDLVGDGDETRLAPDTQGYAIAPADNNTPPLPLIALTLPYLPLGIAIFMAGTRYFDFRNHGIDVIVGAAIGTGTAWWGFRLCCAGLL